MEKIFLEKNKRNQRKKVSAVVSQESRTEDPDGDSEPHRFLFSFYVRINRDLTQEHNLREIRSQLENLEEIQNLTSIYFKKYFSRLLFNEVVIDFQSDFSHSDIWTKAPKSVLRKISNYNDAYKFAQLNQEMPYHRVVV